MAKNKSRKSKFWRVKWILLYIAILLIIVSISIVTAMIVDNIAAKIVAAVYAIVMIIIAIAVPFFSFVVTKKKPKQEVQYGLSKEEHDKYLQQSKNCDIYAK